MDKIMMNGSDSEGVNMSWRHADINPKKNPANADSAKASSTLRSWQTPEIFREKININKAFMQATDNIPVDTGMKRLTKDEADSPLPDEKSNRSAPAARLF